jgi:hypothetical protein
MDKIAVFLIQEKYFTAFNKDDKKYIIILSNKSKI